MGFDTNIDYLTVTFRCPHEWAASVDQVEKLADWGSRRRPWFFYGYSGFSIVSPDGHLAFGRGTRGGIIQASGDYSDLLMREHARWEQPGTKPTRLDLAVTFSLPAPRQLVHEALKIQHDDWTVIVPGPKSGGGTLYVGSRKSTTFGRLYDKGAELNLRLPPGQQIEAAYLWRAEIEYKQAYARQAWQEIKLAILEHRSREFIVDRVVAWFGSRGISLPVDYKSSSIISVASRAVDDVHTLKWLHEQVRPAIWRLAENGKVTAIETALDIQPGNFALDVKRYLTENATQFSYFDKLS